MRWSLVLCSCAAGCGDDATSAIDAARDGASTCAPAAGWTTAPPLARGPTQETATVALDGKLYVLGGFDAALAPLATVQVFDPVACAWSAGPALPAPIHHANAAVLGGRIHVVGGMQGLAFTPVGVVWSWAPGEASWTEHAAMPAGTERGAAVTAAIGDRIVLAGGLRSSAVALVTAYTPATGAFDTTLPALPIARDHGCGGAIGDTLYVTGGRATALQGEVYALAPGGAWEARAAMPTARGGTACGVIDGAIIVVGGEGNAAVASGVFPDVELYRAADDAWETRAPMPTPRHGMGAAVLDGALFVPGGATEEGFGAVATHEVFVP